MRGGVQTTTVDASMNGGGALPNDICEQTMPVLSLQLYAATPQCGRLRTNRNAYFGAYNEWLNLSQGYYPTNLFSLIVGR